MRKNYENYMSGKRPTAFDLWNICSRQEFRRVNLRAHSYRACALTMASRRAGAPREGRRPWQGLGWGRPRHAVLG